MKRSDEEYFNTLDPKDQREYLFLQIQKQKRKNVWMNIRITGAFVVIALIFFVLFGAFVDLLQEVVKWHPIPFDTIQEEFHYDIYKGQP